ncbi:MAG: hypothetical protein HY077_10410 [Elusimicrobia bacterium]|nr:hypothetical protein [Elusimicrobiota bacterium]
MAVLRCAARAAPLLAVCGCAGYTINGVLYRSSNSALKAQSQSVEEQLAEITPLAYVGGSLLVPIPADEDLTSPPFADRKVGRASPAHSFLVRFWKRDIAAAAEALSRAGAFDGAEVRRVDDPQAYAREYGYRFIMFEGGRRWRMHDTVTGGSHELHFVGLKDLAERAQYSASVFQAAHAAPTSRTAPPGEGEIPDLKGGGLVLSVPGERREARARILARVRALCSGFSRIDDEFLQSGALTLRFTCLSQRVSCAACGRPTP